MAADTPAPRIDPKVIARNLAAVELLLAHEDAKAVVYGFALGWGDPDRRAVAEASRAEADRLRTLARALRGILNASPVERRRYVEDERNRFIYEAAAAGEVWETILRRVNAQGYWPKLGSPNAVKYHARTWGERHGKPPLPRRPGGRRPKTEK